MTTSTPTEPALLNLLHWQLLVTAARTGSLAKAAAQQGVGLPTAVLAMAALEHAIGGSMLVDDGRSVRLTALGESLVEAALPMLAAFEALQARANRQLGLHHGSIHVAGFDHPVFEHLAPRLEAFRQLHPQVEIIERYGPADALPQWLARGRADLALLIDANAGLLLAREEWAVAVPTEHPLARVGRERALRLPELADQGFILAHPEQVLALFERAGLALTAIIREVEDWPAALAEVAHGKGVALLPLSAAQPAPSGVQILSLTPVLTRKLSLVARAGAQPAVQVLLDFLA